MTARPRLVPALRWAAVAGLAAAVAGAAVCAGDRALWGLFVACSLAGTGLTVLLWWDGGLSRGQVLAGAVLFRLALLPLPPVLSDDAYRYVWDGLIQAEGRNPYLLAPEDPALEAYREAPLYDRLNSEAYFSVYPPVSQLVFRVGGELYGYGWRVSYYAIKVVFVAMETAAVFLLAGMVAPGALLLYAWSPLVLFEAVGQAHTEAAMVLFLVLVLRLSRAGRGGWAGAALAGAAGVKLYPLVLFPFLWRRHGWPAFWGAAAAGLLLVVPYAHPDAPGNILASLDLYVRLFEYNAGFYYAVKESLRLLTGDDWSKTVGPAMRLAFLGMLPVLYGLDAWRRWPLRRAFLVTLGAFFVLSTTIHPWYFLSVLPLAVLAAPPSWHWVWVAGASTGTYLFYTGGAYWPWVVGGWGGWLLLATMRHGRSLLQTPRTLLDAIQRRRGVDKAARVRALMPEMGSGHRVLDLGAGEGYVGVALREQSGADVVLADVVPMNRTELPHALYNGRTLPFEDGAFDVVVLYFVLHHCADAEQVLSEAGRVCRGPIFVAESTYEGVWDRLLLNALDRVANRLRSGGLMNAQEEHLHFRTVPAWRALFARHGYVVEEERRRGRWVHRQVFFRIARR